MLERSQPTVEGRSAGPGAEEEREALGSGRTGVAHIDELQIHGGCARPARAEPRPDVWDVGLAVEIDGRIGEERSQPVEPVQGHECSKSGEPADPHELPPCQRRAVSRPGALGDRSGQSGMV